MVSLIADPERGISKPAPSGSGGAVQLSETSPPLARAWRSSGFIGWVVSNEEHRQRGPTRVAFVVGTRGGEGVGAGGELGVR